MVAFNRSDVTGPIVFELSPSADNFRGLPGVDWTLPTTGTRSGPSQADRRRKREHRKRAKASRRRNRR